MPKEASPVNRVKTGSVFGVDTYKNITGTAVMKKGDKVCMYGNVSKHNCGTIIDTSKGLSQNVLVSNPDKSIAKQGDSGGPVYIGNKAIGILTDMTENKKTGHWDAIYTPINRATSLLNVSILKK